MCNQDKISAELKRYFFEKNIKQRDIAETLNISQAAVNQLLNGKSLFGKNTAAKWADAFGFSRSFLLTGEGSLFPDQDKPIHQTAIGNTGVTIQQAGASSTASTEPNEGYFMRMAADLMQKLMEKNERICCLERELDDLKNGSKQ